MPSLPFEGNLAEHELRRLPEQVRVDRILPDSNLVVSGAFGLTVAFRRRSRLNDVFDRICGLTPVFGRVMPQGFFVGIVITPRNGRVTSRLTPEPPHGVAQPSAPCAFRHQPEQAA